MFTCLAGHANCSSTNFGRCEKPVRLGRCEKPVRLGRSAQHVEVEAQNLEPRRPYTPTVHLR